MQNLNLSQVNQKYILNKQDNTSSPIQVQRNTEQVKDGNNKIKKALGGLAIAGAVVMAGVGIYKGVIKPKKAVEQITDITQDGIGKLLKENDKLTGKFQKTMKDGSNVVVEYTDGILQKSIKTASDGSLIFEKVYSKAPNGDLLVNNKNITEISRQAAKHQNDFLVLMKKQNASLDELQGFDKKNLSKKQIADLDGKIKTKQDAIKLELTKAEEAKELAEKQAREAQRAAEEAQEAAKKLAQDNEKKFNELIGKPNVPIDELKKIDASSLTSEQVKRLNGKIQILEEMAQAEKAFKDSVRETIPTKEQRIQELAQMYPPDSLYYKQDLHIYENEEAYLDMLWKKTDKYRDLDTKRTIISLSPDLKVRFEKVKKILEEHGISYKDAELFERTNSRWRNSMYQIDHNWELGDIVDYNRVTTAKNGALREGAEPDLGCKIVDKIIDSQEPIKSPQTFYRGVSLFGGADGNNSELNEAFIDGLKKLKVGDVISDRAYSYFSTGQGVLDQYSKNICEKSARMIIQVPQGAKVKIGKWCPSGREGIFPRNAQFRVIKEAEMVNGVPEIVLEYIVP